MIDLVFDDGGIRLHLGNAGPQVTGVVIQRWLTDVVAHVHAAVARNIGDGGLLGRRTGTLARAIMDRVTVTPDGAVGEVFPDLTKAPYGAIQEFGGTVVPKTAQALAIPLAAMLTPNGVARGTAAQVRQDPESFGFAHTFIPKGHAVIFGVPAGPLRGRKAAGAQGLVGQPGVGTVVPLFALKSSVVLPARNYLSTTLTQELTWIADRLEVLAQDVVQVAFGGAA